MKPAYHTALADRSDYVAPPRESVTFPAGLAFVHDIHAGLPPAFAACDVFYGDPPWKAGHERFKARAGQDTGSFERLTSAIGDAVLTRTVPVFLTVGVSDVHRYPPSDWCEDSLLRRAPAKTLVYHSPVRPAIFTGPPVQTDELCAWLATRYQVIGDFLCGYRHDALVADTLSNTRAFSFLVGDGIDVHVTGYFGPGGNVYNLKVTELSSWALPATAATFSQLEASHE